MNALWTYFWPCFAVGLLVGGPTGIAAFRRRSRRNAALGIGLLASLVLAFAWHGPLGGADRFSAKVQSDIDRTLVYYEMKTVSGQLHRSPLTREVLLKGQADEYQKSELVRFVNEIPGVTGTTWSEDAGGMPLIVQGLVVSVLGFLFGLLLAYLVELRRRYNSQWKW